MDYELAKELKDNGFKGEFTGECESGCNTTDGNDNWIYSPTLSELIEACGDRFEILEKFKGKWFCKQWEKESFSRDIETLSEGKTPSEAVAKLWLALNKK